VGWTKAAELTKVARSDGKNFDCAAWMHKARTLPREQFKREVDQHLTGKDTEPTEIIYFKFYESQIPVIEQAIETAALMLGSDKSRGYCLEMICAGLSCRSQFGQREPGGAPSVNLEILQVLARRAAASVRGGNRKSILNQIPPKRPRQRLAPELYEQLRQQVLRRDCWKCQSCGQTGNLEIHHKQKRSHSGDDSEKNLITLCYACHENVHCGFWRTS
jgi:5-methylcytosine-specific restriction endonuclease McrA